MEDIKNPAIHFIENLLYAIIHINTLSTFDLNTQQTNIINLNSLNELSSDNFGKISTIKNINHIIFLCHKMTGLINCFDVKSGKIIKSLNNNENNCIKNIWIMDVAENKNYIALANSSYEIYIYDNRYSGKGPVSFHKEKEHESYVNEIDIAFNNNASQLSFSGIGKTIDIFKTDFKEEIFSEKMFIHDGHRSSKVNSILTHKWHPTLNNTLFSVDDIGILQAWRYKE